MDERIACGESSIIPDETGNSGRINNASRRQPPRGFDWKISRDKTAQRPMNCITRNEQSVMIVQYRTWYCFVVNVHSVCVWHTAICLQTSFILDFMFVWVYVAVIVWFRPSCISCIFISLIMRPSSLGGGRIMRRTLSVRLSVRPSRYRCHRASCTRWGTHIVRPSRPHRFLLILLFVFCFTFYIFGSYSFRSAD